MELQQLKLLAGAARAYLGHANHPIGHSQSLDLIAAVPGLRNWPEVQAFPARVAACEFDVQAAGRLSYRIDKRFGLSVSAPELMQALTPTSTQESRQMLAVWPSGAAPGVYFTTNPDVIAPLQASYAEATDGALMYAERAGAGADTAIDLGEYGLWSSGLWQVPSGTLIVIGPIDFDQNSWKDSAEHLVMGCRLAAGAAHRVAVLVRTPTPDTVLADAALMIRDGQEAGEDLVSHIRGVIDENGLTAIDQPIPSWPPPADEPNGSLELVIPGHVRQLIAETLDNRPTGVLVVGSGEIKEHTAIDIATEILFLTRPLGPVARVMPRHRGTPSKDWIVPEFIRQMPFLPSLQSAVEQGYKRILIEGGYTPAAVQVQYADKALIINRTYGADVESSFLQGFRADFDRVNDIYDRLLAVLCLTKVGAFTLVDLVRPTPGALPSNIKLETALDTLVGKRDIKAEDELRSLLDAGHIKPEQLKEASSQGSRRRLGQIIEKAMKALEDANSEA